MRSYLVGAVIITLVLGGCGGIEDETSWDPWGGGGKADGIDDVPAELAFATKIRTGDIILTSSDPERGCWYLNKLENWATNPRYCHAALVIAREGATGITTIEALNVDQDIQVLTGREHDLADDLETKLAVLRVVDDGGQPLSSDSIQAVVSKALEWVDVEYVEPPISLDGDPLKKGLYCSMLPYRAYLDATGIDLDAFSLNRTIMVPFIVTPDELYESDNTKVVLESAPQDPAHVPQEPWPDEPPADDPPPDEEPPADD